MNADLADHPFSPENVARECGAPEKSERAWLRSAGQLVGQFVGADDIRARQLGKVCDAILMPCFDGRYSGSRLSVDELRLLFEFVTFAIDEVGIAPVLSLDIGRPDAITVREDGDVLVLTGELV